MFHDTVMSLVVVLRDHRARVHLEVDGRQDGERLHRLARRRLHRQGRSRDDELRAAARLVLLLPLLPAADLQVAGDGDPRDDRHPDDLPDPAARAAVRRPPDASGGSRGARSRSSRRSSSSSRWACSRTRARRRRSRSRARSSRPCRSGRSEQGFANNAQAVAGAKLFAAVGLHVVPHVSRHGLLEPRRAGSDARSARAARARSSSRRTSATRASSTTPSCRCSATSAATENIRNIGIFLDASKGAK